jgi:hypothetical protein
MEYSLGIKGAEMSSSDVCFQKRRVNFDVLNASQGTVASCMCLR